MRKDFQEVKRDSLIDEIVNLIDYAEGEIETDEDGLGREYADVKVNWADEDTVRVVLRTMLSRFNVHFKKDEKSRVRAEKVFDLVTGEERKDLMCFAFGLFMGRVTKYDVQMMIAWVKKTRQWKRETEAEEAAKKENYVIDFEEEK